MGKLKIVLTSAMGIYFSDCGSFSSDFYEEMGAQLGEGRVMGVFHALRGSSDTFEQLASLVKSFIVFAESRALFSGPGRYCGLRLKRIARSESVRSKGTITSS